MMEKTAEHCRDEAGTGETGDEEEDPTTGVRVGNRTDGGIHRCTTGMRVVSGLPGDVERNTRRNTGFTVGEAKTSFAWKGYRGNWGFDGRCGCFIGEPG